MMRMPYFILLLLPIFGMAQQQLTVTVTGIASTNGSIHIAVYNSGENFLESDQFYKNIIVESEKGSTIGVFTNLPNGKYALAVFHDENANEKLDTNFIGVPKEPLGFSIGKLKTFGPPSFDECSFSLDADMAITIPIN